MATDGAVVVVQRLFEKKVKWVVAVAAVVVVLRPNSFKRIAARVCGGCFAPEFCRLLLVEQCWGLRYEGRLVDLFGAFVALRALSFSSCVSLSLMNW